MIDRHPLYAIWAPPDRVWSGWAKPVLFAHWPRELPPAEAVPRPDCAFLPRAAERRALVVDLPGPLAVVMGLSLAEIGYQPVPVFSGALRPQRPWDAMWAAADLRAVVDVDAILAQIVAGATVLAATAIPPRAPPAFLIDSMRSLPSGNISPGRFDNRSWIYATDFPSAQRLRDEGISGVTLVTGSPAPLASDLDHVLRVWSRDGCEITVQYLTAPGPPQPLTLKQPSWLAGLWFWLSKVNHDPNLGHGFFVSSSSG